ncbi:MAG: ATP-binding cassette domain-containing protein [Myxococcales bacterium]|nr:ATP-binding cassette domain-containing protein [Myxococcales bacterium]
MASLRVHHLTGVVAGRTLFSDVTLHLTPGWAGLVGPNGAGKTTLLSMLAGHRAPESGHVERLPSDATVLLVDQRAELVSSDVESFTAADDTLAGRWRARLKLEPLSRWATLSFGERKRWQLGAALWREPDVLLLDEPTNHLDVAAIELVLSALSRFDGVGVLVSHDRAVLDRLTTTTLRLQRGTLEVWPGGFTAAKEQWLTSEASRRAEFAALGRQAERLAGAVKRSQREHEASTRQRSAGARMKSKHDSDARGVMANLRAERAQGHLSGAVRRLEGRVEQVQTAREGIDVVFDEAVALSLPGERCPSPVVARLEPGAIETPSGRTLLTVPAVFELSRDARLGIVGANGAGKTTLLSRLEAAATVPRSRVLVMPQDLSAGDALADLERLTALPREARGRVLQWVHALGVDPDALLASRAPSAGETRLLHLALGLAEHPWLVLLDEPTNHLSFDLIERLEVALRALPCALVFVSHDARLVDTVATSVWRIGAE